MSKQNQYLIYVMEKLEPHGPIRARAMFGGHGIYYTDTMFAVIVEDELYFRIDEDTKHEFEALGSKPMSGHMQRDQAYTRSLCLLLHLTLGLINGSFKNPF